MSIKQKNGISLIVLVITIIVMIILATAIILSLNGSGIIGKAKEAKSISDLANAKNVVTLARAEWDLMSKGEQEKIGTYTDYAKSELSKAGYKVEGNRGISVSNNGAINTIYIDSDDRQAIIPEGFTVSTIAEEDTVTEGLVIKDIKGNEFVWVPVDDITKFERTTTYTGTTISDPGDTYTEPFSKTTSTGVSLSLTNDLTGEYLEYKLMRESVKKYKGFYIGRYETGTINERTEKSNETTELVVQRNMHVYNYVGWGPSMTSVKGDVIYSDMNQGKGAVELSRNMYKSSISVSSTLCYGVQWDAALRFIATNDSEYLTNSSTKGNFTGDLEKTGYYGVNNIYDMGGNVYEWTMVACYNHNRSVRGGFYNGLYASFRSHNATNTAWKPYGFRIALYLK